MIFIVKKQGKVSLVDTIPSEVGVVIVVGGTLRGQVFVEGDLCQFLANTLLEGGLARQVSDVCLSLLVDKPCYI